MPESHDMVIGHALRSTPGLADALDGFLLTYQKTLTYPTQGDIIREGLQLIVCQRVISELETMRLALRNLKEIKHA